MQSHFQETQHTDDTIGAPSRTDNIPMAGMNHDRATRPGMSQSQEKGKITFVQVFKANGIHFSVQVCDGTIWTVNVL